MGENDFEEIHGLLITNVGGMAEAIAAYRERLITEGIEEGLADLLTVQFAGTVWSSLWSSATEETDET